MSSIQRRLLNTITDPTIPVNDDRPLRIAVLGGHKLGKLLFISKISTNSVHDTHYPTHNATPILFQFANLNHVSQQVLDGKTILIRTQPGYKILLGSLLSKKVTLEQDIISSAGHSDDYVSYPDYTTLQYRRKSEFYAVFQDNDGEKVFTPILVELIDTPAFKPDQVVPFLEELLYVQLDPKTLHNLANEPRRDVTTNPILVASGAGELNGRIDGYFFVYSAVPSTQPPRYGNESYPVEDPFELLKTIKSTLEGAWSEYKSYRKGWLKGQEEDPFSLRGMFKSIFGSDKENNRTNSHTSRGRGKKTYNSVKIDVYAPPPIWLICTGVKLPLLLKNLINEGMELAKEWDCGFVCVDAHDNLNVELALSLIIREITERTKLQK